MLNGMTIKTAQHLSVVNRCFKRPLYRLAIAACSLARRVSASREARHGRAHRAGKQPANFIKLRGA